MIADYRQRGTLVIAVNESELDRQMQARPAVAEQHTPTEILSIPPHLPAPSQDEIPSTDLNENPTTPKAVPGIRPRRRPKNQECQKIAQRWQQALAAQQQLEDQFEQLLRETGARPEDEARAVAEFVAYERRVDRYLTKLQQKANAAELRRHKRLEQAKAAERRAWQEAACLTAGDSQSNSHRTGP